MAYFAHKGALQGSVHPAIYLFFVRHFFSRSLLTSFLDCDNLDNVMSNKKNSNLESKSQARGGGKSTGTNFKGLGLKVPSSLHQRLRIESGKRGCSMQDLLVQALEMYLSERPASAA